MWWKSWNNFLSFTKLRFILQLNLKKKWKLHNQVKFYSDNWVFRGPCQNKNNHLISFCLHLLLSLLRKELQPKIWTHLIIVTNWYIFFNVRFLHLNPSLGTILKDSLTWLGRQTTVNIKPKMIKRRRKNVRSCW